MLQGHLAPPSYPSLAPRGPEDHRWSAPLFYDSTTIVLLSLKTVQKGSTHCYDRVSARIE
jgi:hypothetical protein